MFRQPANFLRFYRNRGGRATTIPSSSDGFPVPSAFFDRANARCFDRANGELLWQSGVTYADREPTQRDSPYCSATPATDGERVIASFGSAGLYCYDFAGKEMWHRDFG